MLDLARMEVYRSDRVTSMSARLTYHSALLPIALRMNDGGESYKTTLDAINLLDEEMQRMLKPWETEEEAAKALARSRKSMDDLVKEQLGDTNDPAYRRKLYATMNQMYADLGSGQTEPDEFEEFAAAKERLLQLRKDQWAGKPR